MTLLGKRIATAQTSFASLQIGLTTDRHTFKNYYQNPPDFLYSSGVCLLSFCLISFEHL